VAQFKTALAAGAAVMALAFAAHAQGVVNVHDPKPSAAVTAAVADAGRPATDTARDENRKPALAVAVSGVKPGDVVAELGSGGGYYTRILAKAVGPKGKVLAVVRNQQAADGLKAITDAYPNVMVVMDDYTKMTNLPQKPDVIWTTENYHDFHNANPDMSAFNKAMFDALKPGGTFFVEDHAAAAGAGLTVMKTLHRIEPAAVQQEVTAAGFKLVRTSDILHHPEDSHAAQNAEAGVRGKTDRFIMVFRKP
jgi:predicted methyltransferase